jgi:2-(1,2-epoxy-1,2-dihydrophenyl)acetyl-CoA isomerase
MSRALELALLGEKVPAERALEWNLVNAVTGDDQVLPTALEVAGRLAAGPPEALAAIKRLLNEPVLPLLREQLQREADAQRVRADSDEVVEAITAFAQKRKPVYGG